MRFFRRPGFLAASALVVLLVLSWKSLLPVDTVVATVTQKIIAPLTAFFRPPLSDLERENKELRLLLNAAMGEAQGERLARRRADDEEAIRSWAARRSFPAPIIAQVFTRVGDDDASLFLLDRGIRDGVQEHAVVVTGDGILVGRIAAARSATSFLRLTTDRGHRFSVAKAEGGDPVGLAEGQGDNETLFLRFIPREERMTPQQLVVTAGLDRAVPSGLLVGMVRDVIAEGESGWQDARLRPFVHPSDLSTVGILTFP